MSAHTRSASLRRVGLAWDWLAAQPNVLAGLVFAGSLGLYVATLAPGLLWGGGDFATFQTRLYTGEIEASIFGHPLWIIVARVFLYLPIRDVAYRANLAAAVFGAAALAFVFRAAYQLTRAAGPALLATAALMVAHTFWTYAVMPKVYSLNALLLAACLCLVLYWGEAPARRAAWLYGAAALYGLSLLNHLVMATAAVGLGVYVMLVLRRAGNPPGLWRQALVAAGCFLLGLEPYLLLAAQQEHAASTTETMGSFLRGLFTALFNPAQLGLGVAAGLALLLYQFPVTVPAAVVGARRLGRTQPREAWLLGLVAAGDVLFLLGATDPRTGGDYVWNLHYYLQAYIVVALLLAVGLAALWPRLTATPGRRLATLALAVALPVAAYAVAPAAARPLVAGLPGFRELPGRDNLRYVLSPWKHNETGARPLGENLLAALPPNSQLFADYSLWAVVNYLQRVEGARPDVQLFNLTGPAPQLAVIEQQAGPAPMYLADANRYYDLAAIESAFEIVPAGPVYRLVPRTKQDE